MIMYGRISIRYCWQLCALLSRSMYSTSLLIAHASSFPFTQLLDSLLSFCSSSVHAGFMPIHSHESHLIFQSISPTHWRLAHFLCLLEVAAVPRWVCEVAEPCTTLCLRLFLRRTGTLGLWSLPGGAGEQIRVHSNVVFVFTLVVLDLTMDTEMIPQVLYSSFFDCMGTGTKCSC
jgi:hypothetical protein